MSLVALLGAGVQTHVPAKAMLVEEDVTDRVFQLAGAS